MEKYEFSVAVWLEDGEWFYSVIQECDGETETLRYGNHYDPKVALRAVSDCIAELSL